MPGHNKRKLKLICSAIDFDKIHRVREFRLRHGYSAYECSFLLGKQDFFFRDIESPLKTKRINPNDTNYLQLIFGEPLSTFMAPKLEVNSYHLRINTYLDSHGKPVYEIHIQNHDGAYEYFKTVIEEEKSVELPTALSTYSFEEVKIYLDHLISKSFFATPRTALDVFRRCQGHFGRNFHPRFLIHALNHFTNKKSGDPKLDKKSKNVFGRTEFVSVDKNR